MKNIEIVKKNLRTIICPSNIYKVYTRILKRHLLPHIQLNDIILINQDGFIYQILVSKEQFLLNRSILKHLKYKVKIAFIDVKKDFDTVDRSFLIKLIEIIKASIELQNFIRRADTM